MPVGKLVENFQVVKSWSSAKETVGKVAFQLCGLLIRQVYGFNK
jgi:hypothetical protein